MIIRLAVATVAGAIFMVVAGYLIFGMALYGYFQAHTMQYPGLLKNPPNFILLIAAHFAFAALLTLVAGYWTKTRTFAGGARIGAIVTFLVVVWTDLMYESMMELYVGGVPILVDVIVATALGTLTGGVIGFVLGKMDKTAVTE